MSITTRVVLFGWRPSRISRTTSSSNLSTASCSDVGRARALEVEEHAARILETLVAIARLGVELDAHADAVGQRRALDVADGRDRRSPARDWRLRGRSRRARLGSRGHAVRRRSRERRRQAPERRQAAQPLPAERRFGARSLSRPAQLLAGPSAQRARRVAFAQQRQQPDRGPAIRRLLEPIEREQRDVRALPQRVVAVAARRVAAHDGLVERDHPPQLGEARAARPVAQLALTAERARIDRFRGFGGPPPAPRWRSAPPGWRPARPARCA